MEISKLHFAWLSCHVQSAKALKSFNIESKNVLKIEKSFYDKKKLKYFSIVFYRFTSQKMFN